MRVQVEGPKEEPKLTSPLFGFTTNAEIWNSRAAMIGLFSCVILEAVSPLAGALNPKESGVDGDV